MELYQAPPVYEKEVYYDENKQIKLMLVVNTFRGNEYLHLRKYYLDFHEDWRPSSEGVSMPLNIENSQQLFAGLVEILSLAEAKNFLEEHFKELLDEIYIE